MGFVAAVAFALAGSVAVPAGPVAAATSEEPMSPGRNPAVYGGLAGAFATVGLGIAAFRAWTPRCAEWMAESDCEISERDLGIALGQTMANLHAFAFAGAAAGIVGRRAHDSVLVRRRLRIAGAVSLTLGVVLGVTSYGLLAGAPMTNVQIGKLSSGRAVIAEVGALSAITGVALLARVVAQRSRQRRRSLALGVSPSRAGASLTIGGTF